MCVHMFDLSALSNAKIFDLDNLLQEQEEEEDKGEELEEDEEQVVHHVSHGGGGGFEADTDTGSMRTPDKEGAIDKRERGAGCSPWEDNWHDGSTSKSKSSKNLEVANAEPPTRPKRGGHKKDQQSKTRAGGKSLDFWGTSELTSDLVGIMSSSAAAATAASSSTIAAIATQAGSATMTSIATSISRSSRNIEEEEEDADADADAWGLKEAVPQRVMTGLWQGGALEDLESFFESSEDEDDGGDGAKGVDKECGEAAKLGNDKENCQNSPGGKTKKNNRKGVDPISQRATLGTLGTPNRTQAGQPLSPSDVARQRLYDSFNACARAAAEKAEEEERASQEGATLQTAILSANRAYNIGGHDGSPSSALRSGWMRLLLVEVPLWTLAVLQGMVFVAHDFFRPVMGAEAREAYNYQQFLQLEAQGVVLTKQQRTQYRRTRARACVVDAWDFASGPMGLGGLTLLLMLYSYTKFKRYSTDAGEG